jgi:diaminopimelate epimerase
MDVGGVVLYKMTGSGNDFVFVDGRSNPPETWDAVRIREICDRRNGLGADGFAILEPGGPSNHVRFHFFNSDGCRAPMCGNGTLCATRLARWLELVCADEMVLETDAGEMLTRALPGPEQRSELKLGITPELSSPVGIERREGEHSVHFTTVGVPHLVLLVADVAAIDVEGRGRQLRNHAAVAPLGANVNFVSPARSDWAMRTYERGVEAETLACGTGAVACAAALVASGHVTTIPWTVRTSSRRVLTVTGTVTAAGAIQQPCLIGEGRLVLRAILLPERMF